MPTRIVREGILTSEPVASLSWPAEVLYRRLMSVADDHGRYFALPKLIRSACYPLQIDKVSDADIGKWLTECVTAALVSVYPASDGKRYLQIEKFGQRVQSKSKYPDPADVPPRLTVVHGGSPGKTEDIRLGGGVVEDEDGGVGARDDESEILSAYHAVLPACQHISVLNDKRKRRIRSAIVLARRVCKSQGWPYVAADFWGAYFAECAEDEWLRGDKANPNNPKWKQNIDVLLAEDRFAEIMDKAIGAMRGAA